MAVFPTAASVDKLKLYVDNLADPVITDLELYTILGMFAVVDENDTVPSGVWNDFDIYAAAAECWRIKSARAAKYINLNADGQNISLAQIREACNEQYQYYLALATTRTISISEEE